MTPPDESKLSSIDLRLAQWDEARGDGPPSGPTPNPDSETRDTRWQAARRCLDQLDAAFGPAVPPPAPGDEPGTTFGRFVLRRELGQGGFGIVFLADDPHLGRPVALKIPRPELVLTDEGRQRFLLEARAAAALDHPNIVAIHEAGEVGPVAYLAMAYCPGPSLAAWLKANIAPVSPRQAAELVATLADAMHHAHTRGVLHRDLKPANVIVGSGQWAVGSGETAGGAECVNGGRAPDRLSDFSSANCQLPTAGRSLPTAHYSLLTAKIADFGLARRIDDPAMTQTGAVLGTPAYMAPEQAAGRSRDIGTQTDISALGAILYELLAGRPPFEGSGSELLVRIQQEEPLAPRRLNHRMPRDLETICLKCLAKEPARRYGSAAELAADLRRWMAGEPIAARAVSTIRRSWYWAKRRPALAVTIGLFLLALIGGIAGTTWGLVRAR